MTRDKVASGSGRARALTDPLPGRDREHRSTAEPRRGPPLVRGPRPRDGRMSPRRAGVLVALAVALLAALPFVRALAHPFVAWDDDVNFTFNEGFRGLGAEQLRWMWTGFHGGHYMPLTWMSCAFDYVVAGLDPGQFHTTNLVLHAATAAMLHLVLFELLSLGGARASPGRLRAAAALGALLFAVHPLRVESVAWATERRDVLSGALLASTVWTWLRAQRSDGGARSKWLGLSIGLFAASLLSKVAGMTLPLVLLALDAWPLRRAERVGWRPPVVEKLPYFALSAAAAAVGLAAQRLGTDVRASLDERSELERIAISAHALRFYLRKTLLPTGLSPFYELPPDIDPTAPRYALAFAFAVLVTVFLASRRARGGFYAAAWTTWLAFVVLLAPVIGLVHAGRQIAADRYTYLPSFALAAAAAAALATVRRPRIAFAAATAAALALGAASWRQTGYWRDSEVLFRRVVEVEPGNYLGWHKLGVLAHQRGAHDEALERYARALELRPGRGRADALYDRAVTWHALGRVSDAGPDLERALADDPCHREALRMIADLEVRFERPEAALEWLRRAAKRCPDRPDLRELLAAKCVELKRFEEALVVARAYRELAPRDAAPHLLAGAALLGQQRFVEAETELRSSLELARDSWNRASALTGLARALEGQGRAAEAEDVRRQLAELAR